MNQRMHRYLALILLISLLVLAGSSYVLAQDTPPLIPHPLQNYRGCLVCHATGLASAPQVPDSHEGFANEICTTCHLTEEQAEAASGSTPADSGPAAIPHPLEGREDCTACHTPVEGAEVIPAGEGAAPIPHSLEGRDNCLACHAEGIGGATIIPADHEGRTNEICQACHQHGASAEMEAEESVDSGIPGIPHSVVGRDNCLACHEDGFGGATIIPADHEGRTNDVCRACHEPASDEDDEETQAVSGPVPTPIPHPPAQGDTDTCVDCHGAIEGRQSEIVAEWEMSVHGERDVSCADCHGGDPTASTVNASMSPDAGYIGAPDRMDIPALCASCHSDVNLMRQYDLPTDQWAKYQESVHGQKLAQGDENVTTCYDCHGGHKILKANDPSSTVYYASVPLLCASCHSDENLMARYGIPTNQYDLYQQSVHGIAVLEEQDFRAPNCATCHGTHGAAPPGFEEVSNVCGSCHSATQEHYLQSPHAQVEGGPECVTCHGRYDVMEPDASMYVGAEPRHCGSCHTPDSAAGQIAQSIYASLTTADDTYMEAEEQVEVVRRLGMLVTDEEGYLQQANTHLIKSEAVQHTVDLAAVKTETDAAIEHSESALSGAEEAQSENIFRRQAMVIAVGAITLVVIALYLLKRQLDRRLEEEDGA